MNYCKVTTINDQLNDRYVTENAYENVATYPKLITLTTTMRCNYRCWMCYQKHFKGDLDWRIVEHLESVFPFVKTLQLFGGEPLLYERMEELCMMAHKYCCELEIISNGSLLDEKRREMLVEYNASLIKVSLEAATQKTYKSIRGGNLETILGNIEKLAAKRDRRNQTSPRIQINFVAMKRNISELPELVKRAALIGVSKVLVLYVNAFNRKDIALESLYFHQEISDEYMLKAVEVGREHGVDVTIPGFFKMDASLVNDADTDSRCHSPWKNCIINMDGSIDFCCGLTGGPIGSILENDFDALWFGNKIKQFRRLVNTKKQPDCCNTCRVKGRNVQDIGFHVRDAELAKKLITEKGLCK